MEQPPQQQRRLKIRLVSGDGAHAGLDASGKLAAMLADFLRDMDDAGVQHERDASGALVLRVPASVPGPAIEHLALLCRHHSIPARVPQLTWAQLLDAVELGLLLRLDFAKLHGLVAYLQSQQRPRPDAASAPRDLGRMLDLVARHPDVVLRDLPKLLRALLVAGCAAPTDDRTALELGAALDSALDAMAQDAAAAGASRPWALLDAFDRLCEEVCDNPRRARRGPPATSTRLSSSRAAGSGSLRACDIIRACLAPALAGRYMECRRNGRSYCLALRDNEALKDMFLACLRQGPRLAEEAAVMRWPLDCQDGDPWWDHAVDTLLSKCWPSGGDGAPSDELLENFQPRLLLRGAARCGHGDALRFLLGKIRFVWHDHRSVYEMPAHAALLLDRDDVQAACLVVDTFVRVQGKASFLEAALPRFCDVTPATLCRTLLVMLRTDRVGEVDSCLLQVRYLDWSGKRTGPVAGPVAGMLAALGRAAPPPPPKETAEAVGRVLKAVAGAGSLPDVLASLGRALFTLRAQVRDLLMDVVLRRRATPALRAAALACVEREAAGWERPFAETAAAYLAELVGLEEQLLREDDLPPLRRCADALGCPVLLEALAKLRLRSSKRRRLGM